VLLEEQSAALLRRCEEILAVELRQTRGHLRKAATRASAVWELLVIEAASTLAQLNMSPTPEQVQTSGFAFGRVGPFG
jgi:hypothetical protein